MKIYIPDDLVDAVDKYINTDWKGRDPSKIASLNAVAYIGERTVAAVIAAQHVPPTEAETNLEAARKAHQHAARVYAGVKKGPKNEASRQAAAAQLERTGVAVTMALALARMDDA